MEPSERIRIDKWLWAARFFKTRSLASKAVNGGKVHLNGQRIKAAHLIKIGDELQIQRGQVACVVVVDGLQEKRGPASAASLLYEETEDSREKRESKAEERRLYRVLDDSSRPAGRPGKRDRRLIRTFTRKDE